MITGEVITVITGEVITVTTGDVTFLVPLLCFACVDLDTIGSNGVFMVVVSAQP